MNLPQAGILAPLPPAGRYVFFLLANHDADAIRAALKRLQTLTDGSQAVAGIGPQLATALGKRLPFLRKLPALQGPRFQVPSTPTALCLWLRGTDRGELLELTRRLAEALNPAFVLQHSVDAFVHQRGSNGLGRDLTGYEDGTENPEGDEAAQAAFAQTQGDGLDGGSCWALQQWLHDFSAFNAMPAHAQDHAIGRRRSDNDELEDAPESAHVKRTAQESFEPEAFIMRRSMPWWSTSPQGVDHAGLMFSAFGHSFDAFEAQMRRMLGMEDGISDALFGFSRPLTGCYLWCPPMRNGQLDLRQLGIGD
jgi:putative iron-dependent peroxidase